ncbi:hypothetical protein [Chengkuizengella marina]|uniref:Uncharacterized protein n=1 Tax=Chengkuizengella marina TaxID=2507566 RepID=A0A6N9Q8K5_9BACL|nr:hypothetical protein [Chengkuizengella marina]NBI30983.1 hypothetical protein [Chengkuizengella marina]
MVDLMLILGFLLLLFRVNSFKVLYNFEAEKVKLEDNIVNFLQFFGKKFLSGYLIAFSLFFNGLYLAFILYLTSVYGGWYTLLHVITVGLVALFLAETIEVAKKIDEFEIRKPKIIQYLANYYITFYIIFFMLKLYFEF